MSALRHLRWMLPATALAMLLAVGTSRSAAEQNDQDQTAKKGTVSGTVVGEDDKPAADLKVRILPPRPSRHEGPPPADKQAAEDEKPADGDKPADGHRPPRGERPKPDAEGTTDADGKFSIADVPAGEYDVVAGKRGMGMARQHITVEADKTVEVSLKLKKGPREGGPRPGGENPPPAGAARHGERQHQAE
jgi:hypothetical protein